MSKENFIISAGCDVEKVYRIRCGCCHGHGSSKTASMTGSFLREMHDRGWRIAESERKNEQTIVCPTCMKNEWMDWKEVD